MDEDVTSFMLLEATGDSEFDSNIYSIHLADDDAESCSSECGSSPENNVLVYDDDKMDFHADDDDDDDATSLSCCLQVDGKDTSVYNSEEDDEDVVEQRWNGYGGGKKFQARDCGDLVTEKLKNQKEEDRLFWESCLGS
ncbi:hypothetical protein RND71_006984 [Anisodus tanguticus]|uniref:Uncharacterized protein n=1 Tax=Anisodus tanguticus TaxID=243964 RepID=A0AAE1SW90_9SOLA|nr:hypothetical protein RND71_006984 [Anisodus tanguticus]